MSKRDREYKRKRLEEQEAAAHVFQDFIETFQNPTATIGNKAFVRSGVLYSEEKDENAGQIYQPKPVIKQGKIDVNSTAFECAKILKDNIVEKPKKQEKPKSNLDLLKEELKLRHSECLDKERLKEEYDLPSPALSYSEDFSAEMFVEELLTEGCDMPCDETSECFNNNTDLPPYYNETLFKKGQAFFYKHIFGLFLSKLLGLLALLSLPTLRILIMTKKSSTPLTAYKRYMATIFHMCTWYDSDFLPGSRSWTSIAKVRNMHNATSKRSSVCLKYRITQMDMALTQFGFMGLGLIRSKMLGIHFATEEEWKSFVHLWRVVGYVLGIEDRFNVCRDSVQETKEICELLARKVFIPRMAQTGPDFDLMSKALIDGMRVMNPVLQHDAFLQYLHMVLENNPDPEFTNEKLPPLGKSAKAKLNLILNVIWALQYTIVRVMLKYCQIATLWLMRVCPFLAYSEFGLANSHVKI